MAAKQPGTILEEHSVPERHGLLGGKEISTSPDGKLERFTYVVTCDFCGVHPLTTYSLCMSCKGKLCNKCSVALDGRSYCRACLMEILPITKNSYKILKCIDSGIYSLGKITEITKIPKQDIRLSFAFLCEMKLVENKGLATFSRRVLTAQGVEALAVYGKVYGEDEDVVSVEDGLKEIEREEDGV